MKILVLGGAGFLGSNLVRHCLKESKNQVTVVDLLDPDMGACLEALRDVQSEIDFIQGDIRSGDLMAQLVRGQDVIYLLAAQTSHILAAKNPLKDLQMNCYGAIQVLEAVRLHAPESVVVYPSTSTVIGKCLENIADENHPMNPIGFYSNHKAAAENYFLYYHRLYGMRTVVLRFANLYGPYGKSQPEYGFMNHFIHLASKGEPIRIFGNGEQLRNVMYVADALDILLQAAIDERLYGQVFFATSPFHYTVTEIAQQITRIFDSQPIQHVPWPEERLKIEVGRACFSSEKIRAITGWSAMVDLVSGLKETKRILNSEIFL